VAEDPLFAVVDVETTGFSPLVGDRIIEIAILRVLADGSISDEYVTLVNPGRLVGPSALHGIDQAEVENAPTFETIAGDVLERIHGLIVVGHNVCYDREFIAAELSATGIFLPALPCLCTLKMAHRLRPTQANFRLATCCVAEGLEGGRPHEALEEARATAHLLGRYMAEASAAGVSTAEVVEGGLTFPVSWPALKVSGKVTIRTAKSGQPSAPAFLARIATNRTGNVASDDEAAYVDLLDRILEDRIITDREAQALEQTARVWGLSPAQTRDVHEEYLRGVVAAALADGWVTTTERRDLQAVVALLGLEPTLLESMLSEVAEESR
jgi:DNA polymerase-3 subunit epsilon